MNTESYLAQAERWPESGHHILAHSNNESIIVYQAYCPEIGRYAAEHGQFGGPFSYSRMSWIKPNFLWMMYRSGWATKPGQEVTLVIELRVRFFEEILRAVVPAKHDPELYGTREEDCDFMTSSGLSLNDGSDRTWEPLAALRGVRQALGVRSRCTPDGPLHRHLFPRPTKGGRIPNVDWTAVEQTHETDPSRS